MSYTISYFTSRINPRIEWFFDSLALQEHRTPFNVLVVDFQLWYGGDDRREYVAKRAKDRFDLTHITPKPTVWQGPFRKTKEDWWAASSSRNTAIALCKGDFLVCVDDLSVMKPGFLLQVEHARDNGYLVMGVYEKVDRLKVEDGVIKSFKAAPNSMDSRFAHSSPDGAVPYPATSLYGCSFGLPIEAALAVNGFSELCDSVSLEDCEFGARISRTGIKSYLNRNMFTYEDRLAHAEGPVMRRTARPVQGFVPPPDGKPEADWYIVANSVRNPYCVQALGNEFNLRELRQSMLNGGKWPKPTISHDWATGKPLEEM